MMRKNKKSFFGKSREGSIAIALLMIAFFASAIVASYMKFSMHNTMLSRRVIDRGQARIFAESTLDAAENQVRLVIESRAQGLTGGLTMQEQFDAMVPPDFVSDKGNYEVKVFSTKDILGSSEMIETNINGVLTEYVDVLITAGVHNLVSGTTTAFREVVRIVREPFLRYAIFYDGLLELHPGPKMVVNGDMRSNSYIEMWAYNKANSGIRLNGTVQAREYLDIFKSDAPDSYSTDARRKEASKNIKVRVDGSYESFYQDGAVLDSRDNDWDSKSRAAWKGAVTVGDEVGRLKPPIGEGVSTHVLIEPIDDKDSDKVKREKLANRADLYIKVLKDGRVRVNGGNRIKTNKYAKISSAASDEHGVYAVVNDGWINVHSEFYDPRESEKAYKRNRPGSSYQQMQMVDIYVDKLIDKYKNAAIVYVEVEDPTSSRIKPAVRLRNGYDLTSGPSAGFTVASHRTMYVEGDYNAKDPVPALIAADNLTVLSSGWNDKNSKKKKPGGAKETDIHAAVMIGYADPDNKYGRKTGGAHNLVRFREKWTGVKYKFTGSYISLWTAQDSYAWYTTKLYSPPKRFIAYDTQFKTIQPPGMPVGYSTPKVTYWKEIGWDDALAVN